MKIFVPEETRCELLHFLTTLAGSNILFIGGTGLIGRWFFECFDTVALEQLDIDITVTGRVRPSWLKDRYSSIRTKFEVLDFHNTSGLSTVSKNLPAYNQIWFFAAPSAKETFEGASGLSKYQMALSSASFLIDLVSSVSPDLLIVASSGIAVSAPVETNITELAKDAPQLFGINDSLAHSKRVLERACWEMTNEFEVNASILRIFSCYGPHLPTDLHYAFGNFIGSLTRGEKIVVKSDGRSKRSYIYASDLIAMICLEVLRQLTQKVSSRRFNVLNIGSEKPTSILDLAKVIASFSSYPNTAVKVLGEQDASIGNRVRSNYVPDMTYCKSLNIYRERVSMQEGIASMLP